MIQILGPSIVLVGLTVGVESFGLVFLSEVTTGYAVLVWFVSMVRWFLFAGIMIVSIALVNSYVFLYLERGRDGFSVMDVWKRTRSSFWSTFKLVLGISFFAFIALLIVAASVTGDTFVGLLAVSTALVVTMYCQVLLSPFFTVALYENAMFSEAISRSRELLRGSWLSTFGLVAVVYGVVFSVLAVFRVPFLVFNTAIPLLLAEAGMTGRILFLIFDVTRVISIYPLALLPILACTLHYFNLVEKNDGVGMMERIGMFGDKLVLDQDQRPESHITL